MSRSAPLPSFDADTALRSTGPGRFAGHVPDHWLVLRGANGGFIAALVLRALASLLADPERQPRSLTLHYVTAPGAGPLEIEGTVERAGRSLTSLSARVVQEGRLVALALAAFSREREGPAFDDTRAPAGVPGPEESRDVAFAEGVPAFLVNYDMRWALGPPPGSACPPAEVGGWLRAARPRPLDALLVAAYTDAWAPAVFSRLSGPLAAPTVDLTIHFRAPLPPPDVAPEDFCLGVFRSRLGAGGFWEEDGEIWSPSGRLLAQSRQLALAFPLRAPGGGG